MTRWLLVMADRLAELGVTRVVMEATSDYWKGVFYLLEAHGFETWLVNARDVKHLPGRPKTDTLDAVWLCKVAERQMLRPSFVPPRPIRQLRDVTRYRVDLVAARTAEKQRVEKLPGGRPDQTVGGRLRHLRGVGAGHAGRAGRRGA
jgi:transposase